MAAPATPTGGSPRLGPAFSPKPTSSADATPPARRAVSDTPRERKSHESGAHATDGGEAGPSVHCPYCDEVLPSSLVERIRASSSPPAPPDPGALEGVQASVSAGDGADLIASRASITNDDIRRWAQQAGLELPEPPKPEPVKQEEEDVKAIPMLAPPPPPGTRSFASGKNKSRFGFFSKGRADSDGEDDDDLVSGYAKLDEGSDEDEPYEEKPIVFKKRESQEPPKSTPTPPPATANETAPTPATPAAIAGATDPALRILLKEVLHRVHSLTQSHSELASSHTSLLTSLKIARSNLAMAEANTEMLESELKRAKAASAAPTPITVVTPAPAASRGRTSLEGRTPAEPSPRTATPLTASGSKSFGFSWRKSPAPSPVPGSEEEEVSRLRGQVAAQASQLDALKKGKKEIEAELEGLSQALFEEANKMVADERKRRAELEENLREAREEREALRATIKVLGGSAPGTEANSDDETEGSSVGGDLTAHYAALRAGIDRVGARTPQPSPLAERHPVHEDEGRASGSGRTTPDANGDRRLEAEDSPEEEMPGGFGKVVTPPSPREGPKGSAAMNMPPAPVPLETEANPWG